MALPWFVPQSSGLLSSLVITGILFIAVLGLDVLMGYAGQVSLGQAGFMAIGGYTAAILAVRYGWPPLARHCGRHRAFARSALWCSRWRRCGCAASIWRWRRLTFGLMVDSLTVGLIDTTGGPSGLVGIPSFSIGAFSFATPLAMYYLVAALIVVLVLLLLGGMRSGFGRALKAIRTDQTAAAALGINVPRYKMAAFAISAALARCRAASTPSTSTSCRPRWSAPRARSR